MHVVRGRGEGRRVRERGRALQREVRAAKQRYHVAVQHVPQHLREERVPELLWHLQYIFLIIVKHNLTYVKNAKV